MDIKLIPKDYQESKSSAEFGASGKRTFFKNFWDKIKLIKLRLPILVIISGALTILILGGLLVYQRVLKNRNQTLAQRIVDLEGQKDKEMEGELLKFNNNLKVIKPLLAAHFYPSKLLNLIEENTLSGVEWFQVETDLKNRSLTLRGKTSSFNMITEQIGVFSKNKNIAEINTPGATLKAGGVEFSLNLKFKEELVLY